MKCYQLKQLFHVHAITQNSRHVSCIVQGWKIKADAELCVIREKSILIPVNRDVSILISVNRAWFLMA